MSIRLMTMVWDVRWPTQNHLLVMLKLADHANDEGSKVWPAVATIADQAQCSERTVQNVLKALRDCGLINAVKAGGGSMPTIYELNVNLLRGLATINASLKGGADVIEIPDELYAQAMDMTGATVAPPSVAPVQPTTGRGATEGGRGATALHPNHHFEPSSKPSHARSENIVLGSEGKPTASFELTPRDPQWRAWIDFLRSTNEAKAGQAEDAGSIFVSGKWPDNGKLLHIPQKGITDRSKAMTGDAA